MIWLDIGIVNHFNNVQLDIMSGNYKWKIMEQYVGQTLLSSGINRKFDLYYWAKIKTKEAQKLIFVFNTKTR